MDTAERRTYLIGKKAQMEARIVEVLSDDDPDNDNLARQYRFEIGLLDDELAELDRES